MQPASPDAAPEPAVEDVGGGRATEQDVLDALLVRVAALEAVLTPADEDAVPLAELVDDGLTTLSEVVDAVEQVSEAVEAVGERIERIEKAVAEREKKRREHQRVYRLELYDAKTAEAVAKASSVIEERMALLGEWVVWFVRTYRLWSVIPPCWAAHPVLFEELAGLRVAWAGAWTDPEARHDAVVVFNEQAWRARERFASEQWGAPTCTGDRHEDSQSYVEWIESDAGVKAFEMAVEAAQHALAERGLG